MKKLYKFSFFILFFLGISHSFGQFKEPLINLENFDEKRLQWGYYLGANSLNFKYDYNELDYHNSFLQEIKTENTWGFTVGLSGSIRLMKYLDIRTEPGLIYNKRRLHFPGFTEKVDSFREFTSSYIYFPILLKYSSVRWYNFKPYLTAGTSMVVNLSSNHNLNLDNSEKMFRSKSVIFFYEMGVGFDIYTPYFRLSPSIRALFSMTNELVPDRDATSKWTGNLSGIKTRGFVINLILE